jgi:hypothetical protein
MFHKTGVPGLGCFLSAKTMFREKQGIGGAKIVQETRLTKQKTACGAQTVRYLPVE